MNTIRFYRQSSKMLRSLTSSGFFILAGVWLIMGNKADAQSATIGWLLVFLFGAAFLLFLYMAVDRRPQLIISESGIRQRAGMQMEVSWEQIVQASALQVFGQQYVSLQVEPGSVRRAGHSFRFSRKRRGALASVDLILSDLKIAPKTIVSLIGDMKASDAADRAELLRRYFSV